MELKIGLIADGANISIDGKLNVLGQFSQLNVASKFPIKWPTMALVLNIEGYVDDVGKSHKLRVRGVDEDGKEFIKIEGEFVFTNPADFALAPTVGTIWGMRNIVFKKAGVYSFEVYINDRYLNSIPLHVIDRTGS